MTQEVLAHQADALAQIHQVSTRVKEHLSKSIVGQDRVVEELLLSLITGGHVLLEGVPGLAKTMLITLLAESLGLDHARIQFTPDLMPGDILGSEILEENPHTRERNFRYIKGPIFTQVLLADEINRTPPKTQAALLQAMQEGRVSYGGQDHQLPTPFIVFATQNPIENEGTYPFPEAQLDRFMLKILVDYPTEEEERRIALLTPRSMPKIENASIGQDIPWESWRQTLETLPLSDSLIQAAVKIVRQSRPEQEQSDEFIRKNVRWGAGPRASQYLLLGCRAQAALEGQATPTFEHLKKVAKPILRHRVIPSFSAEAQKISADDVVETLLKNAIA